MAVTGILSGVSFAYHAQGSQSRVQSARQDVAQAAADLQPQNLPAAPQSPSTVAQGDRNLAERQAEAQPQYSRALPADLSQTLSQIGEALAAGNLSSAQQAYLSLEKEFQQFNDNNLALLKAAIGNFPPAGLSLTA
jgi:hypothetical protein